MNMKCAGQSAVRLHKVIFNKWGLYERVEHGPVVLCTMYCGLKLMGDVMCHSDRHASDSHHVSHFQPTLHSTECHWPTFNPFIHAPVHYEWNRKHSSLHFFVFLIIQYLNIQHAPHTVDPRYTEELDIPQVWSCTPKTVAVFTYNVGVETIPQHPQYNKSLLYLKYPVLCKYRIYSNIRRKLFPDSSSKNWGVVL
jgi:hypothetical protein